MQDVSEEKKIVTPTRAINLAVSAILALTCTLPLVGQQTHEVDISYAASPDSAGGTIGTVTILRSAGACPASGVPTTFTTLTSSAPPVETAAAPYKDTTVTAGTWCYWATFTVGGATSGPSNTTSPAVAPFSVTVFATAVVK